MIGYLKGKLIKIDDNILIIDVLGVGYRLVVSQNDSNLTLNKEYEFFIHTHVREDQLTFYGFANTDQLKMFELLIGVSGVGPKIALLILSTLSSDEIKLSIQKADISKFLKINGVGRKVSQKIILELQSKIGKVSELRLSESTPDTELMDALANLGFSKREALRMSSDVDLTLSINDRIRLALRKKDEKIK